MLSFVVFFILCFGAAAVGSIATHANLKTWYPTIKKPAWNPPNWVFAPVWSTLYLMMAIAAWLVWEKNPHQSFWGPLFFFGFQLLLNTLWSVIFFGFCNPGAAFIEIVFLWVLIFLTTVSFWAVSWIAGLLFVPYFLWVSFATFLNFTIWHLNKK